MLSLISDKACRKAESLALTLEATGLLKIRGLPYRGTAVLRGLDRSSVKAVPRQYCLALSITGFARGGQDSVLGRYHGGALC